jgi:anti-sigma factor (TIGR02949 family)
MRITHSQPVRPPRELIRGGCVIIRGIRCRDVIEQLWDYLDGELSPERVAGFRAHLEACNGCRAVSKFEAAFLRTVQGVLEGGSSDEAELRTRVVKALRVHGYRE